MRERLRDLGLCVLSAALLVIPFHFDQAWALSFIAFLPYFWALRNKSPWTAFRYSLVCGFVFFVLLGFWLSLVNGLGFILLAVCLGLDFGAFGFFWAFFWGVAPGAFPHAFIRSGLRQVFLAPAFWVVLEYLRGIAFGGLPWALLGYSQWRHTAFIQLADVTGAWGISYLVFLVNVCLFKILEAVLGSGLFFEGAGRERKNYLVFLAAAAVLAVGLPLFYGTLALGARDRSAGAAVKKIRVSVVQGNIPQDQKWNKKVKEIIFEKYKRLTEMSALERPDLIVWPETSFPGYIEDEPILASGLRSLVRKIRTPVLVGAPTLGSLEGGLRFYNSAILLGRDGEERQRYYKIHLVPFGEYIPFEGILGFIRRVYPIGRFSAGDERTLFEVPARRSSGGDLRPATARFGVLICFEDIFPSLVRDFCRRGADFMLNITNDAWFGKTTAPYQHAQASVFRAVENRIGVVRAANTGLSCFISPEGRILATVSENGEEIFVSGHKTLDLFLVKPGSLYMRFGDWFVGLCFMLCIAAYRLRPRVSFPQAL